jgi:hypothetical protein
MSKHSLRLIIVAFVLAAVAGITTAAQATTNWTPGLQAASTGLAHAEAAPAAPAVSAVCGTTAKTITLNWSSVTHATTYEVVVSTTAASGPYNTAPSGSTASTTWTSAGLNNSTRYWYEVVAIVGNNWRSANSAAAPAAGLFIQNGNPKCA